VSEQTVLWASENQKTLAHTYTSLVLYFALNNGHVILFFNIFAVVIQLHGKVNGGHVEHLRGRSRGEVVGKVEFDWLVRYGTGCFS
jgi:hypothetical protein